ncbi:MAG: glycosyl transferase family 36, partial [Dokdonella sp.]
SGNVWSATALPIRVAGASYQCRHGKGYVGFTTNAHAIAIDTTHCVPVLDTIRLTRVRLHNQSETVRRLSLTAYVEWALAANGQVSAPFVITSCDEQTEALFARNSWRAEFANRIAFFDLAGEQLASTCDRREFLGSNGSVDCPAALVNGRSLSGRVGAGFDSCSALQRPFELAPGEQREFLLLLGDAESAAAARALIDTYRDCDFDAVLAEVAAQWNDVLDTVQVQTPDRAMDLVLNDWLLYQTLACRVWARTAYYQSSGAFGFRDQLQDVMALTVTRPDLTREHLLRAAGRQFAEGDVQHWWLPPGGQGIRTRMTDDRLWLAFVTAHYIEVTGDAAVLDESIVFIAGAEVADGADEAFYRPEYSGTEANLYEHCARAIDVSLTLGAHKLPLIGTGDWNDGMNRVGEGGKGESVWLAWFLLATIDAFAPFTEKRKQADRKQRWTDTATIVRAALETSGWDGAWYRRGYYDDGTPLGSTQSSECKIDAIAQSWSVLARANDREHTEKAMAAVDRQLIRRDDQIALLFTPPFDRTPLDPGYIKGYPPGIRENGGQYTHGTIWSIFAFAQLGLGDKAGELFSILNPVNHSSTAEAARKYKVEPYVACADVYSVAPYVGRGGWTWYTGSAGWLYRAGLEAVLGFRVQGAELLIDPCIPRAWKSYAIDYRYRGAKSAASGNSGTHYTISIENPNSVSSGVVRTEIDGIEHVEIDAQGSVAIARIPLVDDGGSHSVLVVLG